MDRFVFCAVFFALGCESVEQADLDGEGATPEDVAAAVKGVIDEDPDSVPQVVIDMALALAALEPCPMEGFVLGKYGPDIQVDVDLPLAGATGAVVFDGFTLDEEPLGGAELIYDGDQAVGEYDGFGGGSGQLMAEGFGVNAAYGEFHGVWREGTSGQADGAFVGMWHPHPEDDRAGYAVGFWTVCPGG